MKSKYAKEITSQRSTERIFPNADKDDTFAKFYNWLMRRREISLGAKVVYSRLGQYAGEKNYAHVKGETLAAEIGISLSQVKRYITELIHFGLIEVERIGKNCSNIYFFSLCPWKKQQKSSGSKAQFQNSKTETNDGSRMSHPNGSHVSHPDGSHVSHPDGSHVSHPIPINRSLEEIQLKDLTHKKERVCDPPSQVSEYSKEQWLRYACSQKNINSPEALARSLAKSKENDYLMRKFIEVEEQQKQKLLEAQETEKREAEELERKKHRLIKTILSNPGPLSDRDIDYLNRLGYCFEQNSV